MPRDEHYMARALRLAELGRYSVHPNPAVGCVLARDGKVVGEGYHLQAGKGHAEAEALAAAGSMAAGATCYVTLEPCSFAGRTPSCAQALIKAGVRRVVAAMLDPDPRNAGAGMAMLQEAGIEVETGLMAASAAALNPGHIKRHTQALPHVRLKIAASVDGKTALANGNSRWITSPESRADVQKLRARASALVTGVQTVIDDDPQLRVRQELAELPHLEEALAVQREVFVLDSKGRTPLDAKILSLPGTIVVTGQDARLPYQATMQCPLGKDGRIALPLFFREVAARGHSEVLLESGGTLAGAAIAAGLVDELVLYMAPRLMGGGAKPLLQLPEIARMADLIGLACKDVRQIGPDIRVTLVPEPRQ